MIRSMFKKIGKSVNVIDITPSHSPVRLAREMEKRAHGVEAGLVVLTDGNGFLWYDMAGNERRDILWALQKMIHELMEGR